MRRSHLCQDGFFFPPPFSSLPATERQRESMNHFVTLSLTLRLASRLSSWRPRPRPSLAEEGSLCK